MTDLFLFQVGLCVIAVCGMAFFQNRKWWIIGASIPIIIFYFSQYFPAAWEVTPQKFFLLPEQARGNISAVKHLFIVEAPIWSICVGLSTLLLTHLSTQSVKEKFIALAICIFPLVICLWLFKFLLEKGINSI